MPGIKEGIRHFIQHGCMSQKETRAAKELRNARISPEAMSAISKACDRPAAPRAAECPFIDSISSHEKIREIPDSLKESLIDIGVGLVGLRRLDSEYVFSRTGTQYIRRVSTERATVIAASSSDIKGLTDDLLEESELKILLRVVEEISTGQAQPRLLPAFQTLTEEAQLRLLHGTHFNCIVQQHRELGNALLHGLSAKKCTFTGTYMRGSNLNRCQLNEASFASANLREVYMNNAWFKTVDFIGADLREASLKDLFFEKANWKGAKMTGVQMSLSSEMLDALADTPGDFPDVLESIKTIGDDTLRSALKRSIDEHKKNFSPVWSRSAKIFD